MIIGELEPYAESLNLMILDVILMGIFLNI
ncbi:MAG: hypothetical protein CM15mV44_0570 [uncultured marine virus]|nr:MAG: hypothetical protein CM15mV44_0570 [uncultured marine virus]